VCGPWGVLVAVWRRIGCNATGSAGDARRDPTAVMRRAERTGDSGIVHVRAPSSVFATRGRELLRHAWLGF